MYISCTYTRLLVCHSKFTSYGLFSLENLGSGMCGKTSLALQENINLGPSEPLQILPLVFSSEFTVAHYLTVTTTKLQ